ncbi:MAG: tetratricopeptide repeat protein [Cyclobacteriaceae bacterium]|nr:tetratricopeptide repeat protein [Cyclobacteriaceae bacterium]
MTRIEQLKQFIAEDPGDPFPRYALALEYLNHEPEVARTSFRELLEQFPDYLPAYYPAAHLLIDLGQNEEAEQVFQSGIELARKQNDRKTEKELRQAYEQWLFDRS